MHPDNYVELRDRKKDVIISGGENITSIEVEQAIESHPAVVEVAVVGAPDERWGEVPVAHVGLRAGMSATEQEIIDHVRARLARSRHPRKCYSDRCHVPRPERSKNSFYAATTPKTTRTPSPHAGSDERKSPLADRLSTRA